MELHVILNRLDANRVAIVDGGLRIRGKRRPLQVNDVYKVMLLGLAKKSPRGVVTLTEAGRLSMIAYVNRDLFVDGMLWGDFRERAYHAGTVRSRGLIRVDDDHRIVVMPKVRRILNDHGRNECTRSSQDA